MSSLSDHSLGNIRIQLAQIEGELDRVTEDLCFLESRYALNEKTISPLLPKEQVVRDKKEEMEWKTEHLMTGIHVYNTWTIYQTKNVRESHRAEIELGREELTELQVELSAAENDVRQLCSELADVLIEQSYVSQEIENLRARRDSLYNDAKELRSLRDRLTESRTRKTLHYRVLRFPLDRSIGDLYVRGDSETWRLQGDARGEIQIPADVEVLLDFIGQGGDFRCLRDGDIQYLQVTDDMAEFRMRPFMKHLSSLEVVVGPNRDWMDHWLTLKKD